MKTGGLDIATCTGMAMVGEEEDRGKTIEVPKLRGFLRLQSIASEVSETLSVWQPEFMVVENYAYVRNIKAFVTLVEVGTAIRIALRQMSMPWVDVPPTSLKKWTTGKGNASKEEMATSVKQRWGFSSHSHDIVDAVALAQMGQLGWEAVLQVPGVTVGWMKSI